ncbi:hypothetical protein LCGC14_2598240 [marine sediment metagenome]|uniref:Uncharacterized protein n=1 Tax=marine sediment metagenome TaxID=412755 RepID=A0A0F9D2B3_9ZZZZ
MAFQKVVDAAEIVIEYVGNAQVLKNVIHASKSGGYVLADLTALAVAVDANITAAWLGNQTQDVSYVQTIVRGLALENDLEAIDNTGAAAGGVLSKGLPGNVTLAIKRTSGLTGRSARGRLYWIGIPAAQLSIDENVVDTTAVADIVSNVESMRASINATVWTPAIVSRFTNGVARSEGKLFTWTGSSAVNNNVDSQRRRLTR